MNKSVLRREFLLAAGVAAVAAPASLCVSPVAAATVALYQSRVRGARLG